MFPVVPQFSCMCSLLVFKARYLGDSSLLCKIYELGCLMWSSNPLLLRKINHTFVIVPNCGSPHLGCHFFPWCGHISVSPTHLCPFTLCCGDCVHPIFRSFSGRIIPYVVVDLLCPWEEVNSRSSSATILNPSSHYAYFSRSSFLNYFRELGRILKTEDEQSKILSDGCDLF